MAGKSVPKAAKTERAAASKWDKSTARDRAAGGAAWAKKFINGIQADPEGFRLQGWIRDAENVMFEDNPIELHAFYDEIQRACMRKTAGKTGTPAPSTISGDAVNEALSELERIGALVEIAEEKADSSDVQMQTLLGFLRESVAKVDALLFTPAEAQVTA